MSFECASEQSSTLAIKRVCLKSYFPRNKFNLETRDDDGDDDDDDDLDDDDAVLEQPLAVHRRVRSKPRCC
jgi:hypothetical protein